MLRGCTPSLVLHVSGECYTVTIPIRVTWNHSSHVTLEGVFTCLYRNKHISWVECSFPEFCTLFDKCLLAKPKCFADKAGNVLAIATCIFLLKSVSFMAFHCQYGWVRYLFPQVHMSLRPRSVTIYWCISWSSCFVGVLCVIKQTLDDPQHIGGSHQAGEFPDWNDFHPEVPRDSRDGLKSHV